MNHRIDFSKYVRAGDTVMWSQGAAEPLTLIEQLLEQRHNIGPFRIFVGGSYANAIRPEHCDIITVAGLGAVGSNRKLCQDRAMELYPIHLSDLTQFLGDGTIAIDVVLMQLARDNENEQLSFGAANGYVRHAIPRARHVIGEINASAPWTFSSEGPDIKAFDLLVETERSLPQIANRPPTDEDIEIAKRVAALIPDGAILQIGIGGVPSAVLGSLHDRRNLGIHGGILGDAAVELIQSGAVNNATKAFHAGVSVTNALAGSNVVYDFARRNPSVRVDPVTTTHCHERLAALPSLYAVNSAIEVDLTGQIASEVAGQSYLGTVGGQVDFVRGARASRGGRSIIALPSMAGKHGSRIVARLTSGIATVGRSDADIFVTEYGVADLRGQSIPSRVRRMIAIAHPDVREELEVTARREIIGYWG